MRKRKIGPYLIVWTGTDCATSEPIHSAKDDFERVRDASEKIKRYAKGAKIYSIGLEDFGFCIKLTNHRFKILEKRTIRVDGGFKAIEEDVDLIEDISSTGFSKPIKVKDDLFEHWFIHHGAFYPHSR